MQPLFRLFVDSSPEKWLAMNELSHHNAQLAANHPDVWQIWQTVAKSVSVLLNDVTEEEVLDVLGICSTNNANLNLGDKNGPSTPMGRGTGLYLTYARMNHSCYCNTRAVKYDDFRYTTRGESLCERIIYVCVSQPRIVVRAAINIRKGEEIYGQYVKPHMTTVERRETLLRKWNFRCECPRCVDETEFGTHFSAVLCQKCNIGPLYPAENNNEGLACLACSCSFPESEIEKLGQRLERILSRCPKNNQSVTDFLEEQLYELGSILHPNHSTIIDFSRKLVAAYKLKPVLTRTEYQRVTQLCQQILEVLGRVDPGYSSWRGDILCELIRSKVASTKIDLGRGQTTFEKLVSVLKEEKFLAIYLARYKNVYFGEQ